MSAFLVCDACGLEAHTPGYRPRGWDTAWSKESVPSSMDQIMFDSAPSDDLAFDLKVTVSQHREEVASCSRQPVSVP